MEQGHCTLTGRKGKHLTRAERVVIEAMRRGGIPARRIASTLNRDRRTIQREVARGLVENWDLEWRTKLVYSSDRGQDVHDLNATAKGPPLKLGSNRVLVEFVRERIVEHRESPAVVAFRMRTACLADAVCAKTLYTYIDQGLIAGVSNESLWEKRQRRKRHRHVLRRGRKAPIRRESIEKRPPEIANRQQFGHWEIDLVVGPVNTSHAALLTLVERKTRALIVRKLPDKSQASVLRALRRLEREYGPSRFRRQFLSVTADNGSEFLDVESLQSSAFSRKQRTRFFYAHAYASWERGSNENANRMIRRFIAKGSDIQTITFDTLRTIERWINQYPRQILAFASSQELFDQELLLIAA
jgi:IS30 family transposase